MKISSRIEGSLCGAILSSRGALWSSGGGGTDKLRTLHGGGQWRSRRRQQQSVGSTGRPSTPTQWRSEDNFFTPWIPPPVMVKAVPYTSRATDAKVSLVGTQISRRWSHSTGGHEVQEEEDVGEKEDRAALPGVFQDKQEMLGLVDQIQQGTVSDYLSFQRDPYMRGYAPADGPEITVSDRVDDKDFPDFSEVHSGGVPVQETVAKLWRAINRRLVNPYKTDIDVVYRLYRKLPEPRISYLHARIRHKFMVVLGREEKNRTSMLRYFAVVADIRQAGLRLTRPEWNSAMAFAARWVGHSQNKETTAAMRLWKEMETDAGIKSNTVTFNILFDVATKAGNFVLAEMLYREMDKRKLPWNRYHHVSLIHFFGLKMDSDGIRAAYKEMVEAGELIDTVVLNCVIAGFLRCGEEDAAERVYERMKAAHDRAPAMPYRNYMKNAVISKVLMMFAKISRASANKRRAKSTMENGARNEHHGKGEDDARGDPTPSVRHDPKVEEASNSEGKGLHNDLKNESKAENQTQADGDGGALRRHFQKLSPIVPDLQTYRIFLNHYAVRSAALDKVAHFLDDMKWFHIPLHGTIFLALFKGFALYGGPGQQWSHERLNTVYGAFSTALEENANGMYMDVWMARWLLRAFRKCETEERLWEVWAELQPRCEAEFEPEDLAPFEEFLIKLMHPDKQHATYSDTGMFGEIDPGRPRRAWRR